MKKFENTIVKVLLFFSVLINFIVSMQILAFSKTDVVPVYFIFALILMFASIANPFMLRKFITLKKIYILFWPSFVAVALIVIKLTVL